MTWKKHRVNTLRVSKHDAGAADEAAAGIGCVLVPVVNVWWGWAVLFPPPATAEFIDGGGGVNAAAATAAAAKWEVVAVFPAAIPAGVAAVGLLG